MSAPFNSWRSHHWLASRDGPPCCCLVSIMLSSFCSDFPPKHVLFHVYIFHIKLSDMIIVEGKHQWMNERLQLFQKHSITLWRSLWSFLGLNRQLSSKLCGQIATEMWIQIDIPPFLMPLCSQERPILVGFFFFQKKSEEDFCFYEKRQKAKIAHPEQGEWLHQAPSPETTPNISASGCHSVDLCLWASVLYLHSFYASVSKMCPKISEKPERAQALRLRC